MYSLDEVVNNIVNALKEVGEPWPFENAEKEGKGMMNVYNTPKVLHLQGTDSEGNKRIIRYFREDTVEGFETMVRRELQKIREEADSYKET